MNDRILRVVQAIEAVTFPDLNNDEALFSLLASVHTKLRGSVRVNITVEPGEKKINVIKEIRAVTNIGLKEAKDLTEGSMMTVDQDTLRLLRGGIEALGGRVKVVA